jgi:hypothetical protein
MNSPYARGRVAGCLAVGGVFAAPGEQHVALVQPGVPKDVENQDRPVHRPVRQDDVEPGALGQPVAQEREQLVRGDQETAEAGAG